MKRVGIITINDNDNYGNRLQNYALQEVIKKYGFEVITIKNDKRLNNKVKGKHFFINIFKFFKNRFGILLKSNRKRLKNFKEFNKNIKFSEILYTAYTKKLSKKYDFFITGSDQVWKPIYDRMSYMDLLCFAESNQKIAYAPSFGISNIESKYHKFLRESLKDYKYLSVREKRGAEIINEITGKNAEVVLDPTLLLDEYEWGKVEKKIDNISNSKYILTYFLGNNIYKEEIDEVAKKYGMKVINLMDKNCKFYQSGPSEFLYLFHNSSLIFTDSFHACVFSIIYKKPFFVFERAQKGMNNMNSRLDSLLQLTKQEFRHINSISEVKDFFENDYAEVNNILEKEKQKSINFLKKALDIEEGENNE